MIPLVLGLFLVVVTMLAVVVDVTAAHLGHTRAMDVADAAARDAADAVSIDEVYTGGIDDGRGLPALTTGSVRVSAERFLASVHRPPEVLEWHLGPQTGTPDGRTAVVTVIATVRLPMANTLLPVEGTRTVSAEAHAVALVR